MIATRARTGVDTALVHTGQVSGALGVDRTLGAAVGRAPDVARRARTDRCARRGATHGVGAARARHTRVAVFNDYDWRLIYSSRSKAENMQGKDRNSQHQTNTVRIQQNIDNVQ